MTQVSKYPVSKDVYERIFEIFLKEFLTPTEQVMLAKRLSVAFLLSKDYNYREISKILRVSTGTVNRVALSYRKESHYKMVIEEILRDERMDEFWRGVGETGSKLFS